MNGNPTLHKNRWMRAPLALAALLLAGSGFAQVPVDDDGNPYAVDIEPLDNGVSVENPTIGENGLLPVEELETLVGPIALYPDDLLAIVLPASTYPLEIVQAARFLERLETDPSLEPDEDWDDSIVALLNYPDILKMMNEDIDWTWKLGEAIVSQQAEVILAIETFRDRAYAAGNLKSDEHQTVTMDEGIIEIEPIDDDVIYVPYYEPTRVVTYSPTPVYHYYPRPYPVYYYPYSYDHYFGHRPFWGVTTAFTIGWRSHRLNVYHPTYVGHPYYGYNYRGTFWRRPSINIYNSYYADHHSYTYYQRSRNGDRWRPRYRSGARPRQRTISSGYSREADRRNVVNTSRGNTRTTNRRNGNSGNAARTDRDRPAIEFRPRGDGAYTGRRTPRVERDASSRRDDGIVARVRDNARQAREANTRNTRRAAPTRPQVERSPAVNRDAVQRRSTVRAQPSRPVTQAPRRPNRQSAAPRTPNRQSAAPRTPNRRSTAPRAPNRQSTAPANSPPRPAAGNNNRRSASSAPRRSPPAGGGNRRKSGESARRDNN